MRTCRHSVGLLALMGLLLLSNWTPSAQAVGDGADRSGGTVVLLPTDWVLLPKEVYVGDRGELRCSVGSEFHLLPEHLEAARRDFQPEDCWGAADEDFLRPLFAGQEGAALSVHSLSIQRSGDGYEVSLVFSPWQTGTIEAGYLDVGSIGGGGLLLRLPPLEIASLTENMEVRQLQPVAPPVLVPGSIYVVYALAVAGLLLLVGLVVLLARFQQVRLFFRMLLARLRRFRNYRAAVRQLGQLGREPCSCREFAGRLEAIVRSYLELRFARPFMSATTSEILPLMNDIFAGTLSSEQMEVLEGLWTVLHRCDYLRYAPDGRLEDGEELSLLQSVRECLRFMEERS